MTKEDQIIGIIGGTGLGDSLSKKIVDGKLVSIDDTPFGKPSDSILVGKFGKRRIAFLNRHGPGHIYNPSKVPFAANIWALKRIGVKTLISMGAVGSLQENIRPGDLVIVDQFIDKTIHRQGSFFQDYGAVHVEMAEPACSRLRDNFVVTADQMKEKNKHTVHKKGTYVCMEGPSFSTRAESLMHRSWGGDLIGMTAMPEAKLAREAQMCYVLIALVSDYDCWRPHDVEDKKVLLQEIIENMQTACTNCVELIEAILCSDHALNGEHCVCRKSLELAVWTNKEGIKDDEQEKVKILFD